MSAASIFFALLIALFLILMLYRMGRLKPQIAGIRSYKDVPVLRFDHILIATTACDPRLRTTPWVSPLSARF